MSGETASPQSLALLSGALDASIDPACLVDPTGKILVLNVLMKGFLRLKKRHLTDLPVLCDLIKFDVCKAGCRVVKAIQDGAQVSLSEVPSVLADTKMRVVLKITPILGMGAIVAVRDTSA